MRYVVGGIIVILLGGIAMDVPWQALVVFIVVFTIGMIVPDLPKEKVAAYRSTTPVGEKATAQLRDDPSACEASALEPLAPRPVASKIPVFEESPPVEHKPGARTIRHVLHESDLDGLDGERMGARVIDVFCGLGGCPCSFRSYASLCSSHDHTRIGRIGWQVTSAMLTHSNFKTTQLEQGDARMDCSVCGAQWVYHEEDIAHTVWIGTAVRVQEPAQWLDGALERIPTRDYLVWSHPGYAYAAQCIDEAFAPYMTPDQFEVAWAKAVR
jgi:hypothetical protein